MAAAPPSNGASVGTGPAATAAIVVAALVLPPTAASCRRERAAGGGGGSSGTPPMLRGTAAVAESCPHSEPSSCQDAADEVAAAGRDSNDVVDDTVAVGAAVGVAMTRGHARSALLKMASLRLRPKRSCSCSWTKAVSRRWKRTTCQPRRARMRRLRGGSSGRAGMAMEQAAAAAAARAGEIGAGAGVAALPGSLHLERETRAPSAVRAADRRRRLNALVWAWVRCCGGQRCAWHQH